MGIQGAPASSNQDGALGPPAQTDLMELHKLAEVVNSIRSDLKEKSSRKDKKQSQFQPESQEVQEEEEEKEEAQPIRLQLEFPIDNFFGLKLCPVEASGQEQEGGCGSYGEGRRSSFQESLHLCCQAPGCPTGKLHQWDPPEAHEGWNS